jgi:hypothetical protein
VEPVIKRLRSRPLSPHSTELRRKTFEANQRIHPLRAKRGHQPVERGLASGVEAGSEPSGAAIALNRHQPVKAIEDLAPAVPFELGEHNPLLPAYFRGQAYLAAACGPEGAAEFQKIIDHRGLIQNSILGALAQLGLARAHKPSLSYGMRP